MKRRDIKRGGNMLEEYNIDELNPRRNPYAKEIKKPITINVGTETVEQK